MSYPILQPIIDLTGSDDDTQRRRILPPLHPIHQAAFSPLTVHDSSASRTPLPGIASLPAFNSEMQPAQLQRKRSRADTVRNATAPSETNRTGQHLIDRSGPATSTGAATRPAARSHEEVLHGAVGDQTSPAEAGLVTAITELDDASIRRLLLGAAQANKDLADVIMKQYHAIVVRQQRARVVDFNYLSKSAWHTLNITYAKMRCSKQFEVANEASIEVQCDVSSIVSAVFRDSSYGTKKSAIVTLRKIGKTICLMQFSEIRKRVHRDLSASRYLEKAMLHVVECLKDTGEIEKLLQDYNEDILSKLMELATLADGLDIFDVNPILELLGEDPIGGTEEDSDDDEEDHRRPVVY